jgi:hypothetical protein
MIDHFLVGSFAGGVLPVGVGGEAARCPLRIIREARSGAGLGALPAEMNKLLALDREGCQQGSAFLVLAVCHRRVSVNKYPQVGALSKRSVTISCVILRKPVSG